ncbi:MAG: DUF6709 family protein [Candidatus Angelobacter sp.]
MVNWLEAEVKRANRNLLLANGFVLLCLLGMLYADWQYYANFALGCKLIDAAELSSLTSPTQHFRNFVTVRGSKSVASGYEDTVQNVEESSGQVVSTETKDEYILLKVGERILLVKAPNSSQALEFSGQLAPTTDAVKRELIAKIASSSPDIANMILPFTLDATDYRTQGYWALGIGVPLFLLCCWNLSKVFKRTAEPQLAPLWKHVSVYGNAEQLSSQIGSELLAPHDNYKGLHVTQSWLIRKRLFSTWVSPLNDIVWVYKKVTRRSVNFIPTGKSYSAIIVGRHRQRIEHGLRQKNVDALLSQLALRVPWAVDTFNADLDNLWKKDPGRFIAAVDSRREQLGAKAATAGS